MPHDVTLIALIAAGFGLALALGLIASALRMPPLVGYLLAGVMISPHTPGFVGDVALAAQLSEIGVMLLMFGVGLHFSIDDLIAVRRIAVPGAIVQIAIATALGAATALAWGWTLGAGLVFGLCLSVASTVVLLRALEATGQLTALEGRIALGWLVVEDLVMVLVLVLLPPLAGTLGGAGGSAPSGAAVATTLGITLTKIAAFVVLMLVLGKRALPHALWWVARTGSRELFTLAVIAAAIGVAFGAAVLFDVSFALGAFFAGMTLRESEFGHRAADESLPLRDAFAVLFFVAVGMLFDPAVLWTEPLRVLAVVAIIVIGKTVAAIVLVRLFRYPLSTAATIGASLAQIGEFSFILVGLGVALELVPEAARSLVVAGALISIAANSAVFRVLEAWARRAGAPSSSAVSDPLAQLPAATDAALLSGHVVLVGHGELGRTLAARLHERGLSCVIVDRDRGCVDARRRAGQAAVAGEATQAGVLIQAHVARAKVLALAIPLEPPDARSIIATARTLNPGIAVVMRVHDADEAELIVREGLARPHFPVEALAQRMADDIAHQHTS